jgi:hypothetical protein
MQAVHLDLKHNLKLYCDSILLNIEYCIVQLNKNTQDFRIREFAESFSCYPEVGTPRSGPDLMLCLSDIPAILTNQPLFPPSHTPLRTDRPRSNCGRLSLTPPCIASLARSSRRLSALAPARTRLGSPARAALRRALRTEEDLSSHSASLRL